MGPGDQGVNVGRDVDPLVGGLSRQMVSQEMPGIAKPPPSHPARRLPRQAAGNRHLSPTTPKHTHGNPMLG